jgi:hypothetical protein
MSDPDNPTPLEYRRPEREPTPEHLKAKNMRVLFAFGLLSGVGVSVIIWIVGWDAFNKSSANMMIILPAVKIAAAIGIIFIRPMRGFGLGLLTSIPIGALIFGYQMLTHCGIGL